MQSKLLVFVILFTTLMASVSAMEIRPKSKNEIQFSHELLEVLAGVIDVTLEGQFDLENLEANKLGAFLKIAGKTFPILESSGLTKNGLQFKEEYCWEWGFLTGCAGFTFEFYIGWYISDGTAEDYNFLNVTLVPFVQGEGSMYTNIETWPMKFSGDFASRFVNIDFPISNQLNFKDDVEFCYDANTEVIEPTLVLKFTGTVKSCRADMADNIYHPGQFDYKCDYGSPIVVPVINNTDVPIQYYNLLSRTCLTLYHA